MTYTLKMTAATAVAILSLAGAASAATMIETFDTNPPIAENQAPGVYYEDRYPPAGFESEHFDGDNRLKVTLSEDDGEDGRPKAFDSSFYNTQGRKLDTPGATAASIDIYIADEFTTADNRIGGLWGSSSSPITAPDLVYPIIEFHGSATGGSFNVWDSNNGGWQDLGLPGSFTSDNWYTIGFVIDSVANTINYFLDGTLSYTDTDAQGALPLDNVIIQAINTPEGIDRTIYFDNLSITTPAVPLPAGLPLIASALGIFGALRLKKRKAA
ncbi:VPLPA-CTERM sorting domain-containing protein [Pseudooceanicola batsensis]|nr:VPLPA-CTERM sorting domain-containing protein [Pseudooceanicola batsensis]